MVRTALRKSGAQEVLGGAAQADGRTSIHLRLPWFRTSQAVVARLRSALLLVCLVVSTGSVWAGQERYEYDALGRLIVHIDASNEAARYTYDAAGNLLTVVTGVAALPAPSVSSLAPAVVRRGETKTFLLTGQNLANATVQTPEAGLTVTNLQRSATQIQFDLSAGSSVPLGTNTLTVSSAAGSTSVGLTVRPALPVISVEPSPLALPPNNAGASVTLRLSNADVVAHAIAITSSDASKITVNPGVIALAAGQTTASFSITSLAAGFANLQFASPELATQTVPVFVTSDFRGVNTSYATPVGIVVGSSQPTNPTVTTTGPFLSAGVGVSVGSVLVSTSPRALGLGDNGTLTLRGAQLPASLQISIEPSDGITLGTPIVAADGSQVTANYSVDTTAPTGVRRLVVVDTTGQAIAFANVLQSQVQVVAGLPLINSIEPLFAVAGTTITLKVRGTRLQGGLLSFSPITDLFVGAQPTINADGTEISANVQIAPAAPSGLRVVQVATAAGVSAAEASPANSFTVVSQVRESVSPIMANLVGVQVGTSNVQPVPQSITPVVTPLVGVAVGAFANSVSPPVGVLGATLTAVIRGQGLQAVTGVSLQEAGGVSLGAFTVNAEGTQLDLPLTIAANAPRTLRRFTLETASGPLPFLSPNFLVAAPVPEVSAIGPQVVLAGQTVALNIYGQRFTDVLGVRIEPSQGLSLAAPVDGATPGSHLVLSVQIAPGAASGPRTLVVVSASGESSSVPVPGNTFQVAQQVGANVNPILSASVGVMVGNAGASVTPTVAYDARAPLVGVLVQTPPAPAPTTQAWFQAANVGIVVGSAPISMVPGAPNGFLKGSSGHLTIQGVGLDVVSSVNISGNSGTVGITLGTPVVNPQGTQLVVPIAVDTSAVSGQYRVSLSVSGGSGSTATLLSVPANALAFAVGALPVFNSSTPIVLEQGEDYLLTLRGAAMADVYGLLIEGGTGVTQAPETFLRSQDALGEFVQVRVYVQPTAPIGNRVVRLQVPGGLTSATPTPVNTLTVVAPQ
jgi:YD repeat-containing protein